MMKDQVFKDKMIVDMEGQWNVAYYCESYLDPSKKGNIYLITAEKLLFYKKKKKKFFYKFKDLPVLLLPNFVLYFG